VNHLVVAASGSVTATGAGYCAVIRDDGRRQARCIEDLALGKR
jgi:hypothetical protein